MSDKLDPALRAQLQAAGDDPVDLIIRTTGSPRSYAATCAAQGVVVRHTYNLLPGPAVSGPASKLLALASEPWVAHVEPDRSVHTL